MVKQRWRKWLLHYQWNNMGSWKFITWNGTATTIFNSDYGDDFPEEVSETFCSTLKMIKQSRNNIITVLLNRIRPWIISILEIHFRYFNKIYCCERGSQLFPCGPHSLAATHSLQSTESHQEVKNPIFQMF